MKHDKIKGLIYGAFIGDAMALGPHWIYDTAKIQEHFAPISGYTDPGHTNFHANKSAGDFTHYGDQALLLLTSIAQNQGFNLDGFKQAWIDMMDQKKLYLDAASKDSLERLQEGNLGSTSDELGGFARSAPLFALEDVNEDLIIDQVKLTHTAPQLITAARYFIRVLNDIIQGDSIETSLLRHKDMDPFIAQAYKKASTAPISFPSRIKDIGQNCHSPYAMPAVLTIALHEKDFKSALIQNVYAGGDSAARGMVLGMLYGAREGYQSLPKPWIDDLNALDTLEQHLAALIG